MSDLQKILVFDNHEIVFSGIQLILQSSDTKFDFMNCKSEDECFKLLKKQNFDLIIMEVNLYNIDTYQLIGLILINNPKQKILMFSMSSEELYAKRFLKHGALGFVSKESTNDEFKNAVFTVLNGETYVSTNLSKIFTQDIIKGNNSLNGFDKLTSREFEIMSCFLQGKGSKEICNIMHLHSSTIGTYKSRIFKKLGVKNLLELKEMAHLNGIK